MSTNDASLMLPTHPGWIDFYLKLSGSFPKGVDAEGRRSACGHTHRRAEAALREMAGIDVARTLAIFRRHEGRCDCEVLLEFEDRWRADVLKVGPKARPPRD